MIVTVKTLWRCDVCGKESEWIKGQWIAVSYAFGSGYAGWEYEFHVCGNACDNRLKELGKKIRLKMANDLLKQPML